MLKENTPTHINALMPTYPIQKDPKTRHITYTKQIIRSITQYIHAKAQTIQRCKQNQKHVKQCNIYKHQRENNACLMSAHKYYDRGLSVCKNRASTRKSKCFNQSNKFTTQVEITMYTTLTSAAAQTILYSSKRTTPDKTNVEIVWGVCICGSRWGE